MLLSLDGVEPDTVEMTAPLGRRSSLEGVLVHRTRSLPACDVAVVCRIPSTNASRTLLDLGAVVDEEILELALEDALRRGLTSLPRLEWRISQLCKKGRAGCLPLRRLLDERRANAPTESALETKLARLIRKSDLPQPDRQYQVPAPSGQVMRVDFAYPREKVAVEADGYRWHSGRRDWERELRRRNDLQGRGWAVLHVTSADLRNSPDTVLENIRAALRARGRRALF